LENLLGSPCIKRRIRGRAIRDYQMGEHKNPSHPFNVSLLCNSELISESMITNGNKQKRQLAILERALRI
jgi:hypothetical protein